MRIQMDERCPCGAHLTLSDLAPEAQPHRYSVHCDECYDGSEDGHPKDWCLGHAATPEGAYAHWWEQAGNEWHLDEMGWSVVLTVSELSEQAGDEADRQDGWSLSSKAKDGAVSWFGPAGAEHRLTMGELLLLLLKLDLIEPTGKTPDGKVVCYSLTGNGRILAGRWCKP